ncbi:uroporphyrinogen decarboxylase family protein [Hydrogenoanaerobacterium sp.]|uniref:uroporphyrinogen decarboxylase family protein n=1 Tax=Hydrogenoanaerobacterium sp. TaxID=2953763 RepID=UPI002899A21B|nr:uroporphyrinogen decarboxylase family protein [Hydrogenoanaerobacterium sp.]
MTHRQLFFDVCNLKHPQQIPFAPDVTDWYLGQHRNPGESLKYGPGVYIPDDDPIKLERGIGIPDKFYGLSLMDLYKKYNWGMHAHIRDWYEEYYSDGVTYDEQIAKDTKTVTFTTSKGVLRRTYRLAADGSWCSVDYMLDDVEQMEILFEVLKATHFRLRDDNIQRVIKAIGEQGQADIVVNRSPFGKLLHEHLGFENTTYFLYDDEDAYRQYEKIQTAKDMELIELACQSSCSLVLICDHADSTLFSPEWYEKYCIPFYQAAGDKLRKAGKMISTHVDGNLKSLLPLMKDTGFDVLDGCTPAPMFNYEPEELANSLGENMVAFVGVPSALFCDGTPVEALYSYADRIIKAFGGRAILNVGDILPANGSIENVIALGEYIHRYNAKVRGK